MTEDDVRLMLRQRVEKAGGQRALAREFGVSAPYLNDILFGRRGFSDAICAKLGLARTVTYAVTYAKKTKRRPIGEKE